MKEIENFTLSVKNFKKMDPPFDQGGSEKIIRYVMYADINSLSYSLGEWFKTNPRHQNIKQKISKGIQKSLIEESNNFHNLNKGLLLSAKEVVYDKLNEKVNFLLEDKHIHGNIDGGHTLKVINDYKKKFKENFIKAYVFIEIITGIESVQQIVALAGARNKTVQVDSPSLANLEGKFEPIKILLERHNISFRDRIIYKKNENKIYLEEPHKGYSKKDIEIREIIAILNMFNLDLYPIDSINHNHLVVHPTVSYSGKDQALKRFLGLDDEKKSRNAATNSKSLQESVFKMGEIFKDIFLLYDLIELELPEAYDSNNRRYRDKSYAPIQSGSLTKFGQKDLTGIPTVPKGLIYPLLGSFRALLYYDERSNFFHWHFDPLQVWKEQKKFLANVIADFIDSNKEIDKPDPLGKSKQLWSTLFDKVKLYKMERQQREGNSSNGVPKRNFY